MYDKALVLLLAVLFFDEPPQAHHRASVMPGLPEITDALPAVMEDVGAVKATPLPSAVNDGIKFATQR